MENKLKTVDAETLLSTPMSKTVFIVDNLIPQGVNVISGASKIGKSWLMLWLGLQVAQGLPVWGLTTQQCDVLYLSLEDTQRRIKDRLYNLTDTAPSNLYFAVMCGLIGGGLEEQITDFLSDHPKTKLVIIDTLQKVRDTKGGAGKTGMYGNDYDDISSIDVPMLKNEANRWHRFQADIEATFLRPAESKLKSAFNSKIFWREKQERTLKNIRFLILKTL